MKECPFCAEEIQDRAIKCRHCGEWLQEPPAGRIASAPTPTPITAQALPWDEAYLKPILKCPQEDLIFLTRALAKHFGENLAKNLSDTQLKEQAANLAIKLQHQHPEALLAIYRIFQLCRHDETWI